MVDNDTLTYHVKKTPQNQAKNVDNSLITQERAQKLDLLMHLLTNLTNSLVVCGPEGIGKTTLLKVLQTREVNAWHYCSVQGDSELSFEKILQHIARTLSQDKSKSDISLSVAFGQCERQNKKMILMIDDAGDLVPGLITSLIQYASSNPALRIIFALTHDDLYVKNTTDRAIEDCHFVEIPPLTEKQCGEFLQHLSAMPFAQVQYNSINDSLIEKIYRETHGIPGKIIDDLPEIAKPKVSLNPTVALVLAVVALVLAALSIQWYSNSNFSKIKATNPIQSNSKPVRNVAISAKTKTAVEIKPDPLPQQNNTKPIPYKTVEPSQIAVNTRADANKTDTTIATNNPEQPIIKPQKQPEAAIPKEPISPLGNQAPLTPLNNSELSQQLPTKQSADEVSVAKEAPGLPVMAIDGVSWITAQPAENFTLQVMVLTKEPVVQDIVNKYKALEQPLTYIKKVSPGGREKFLVIYGSFSSLALANKAKQGLPAELRQSFARNFNAIKAEMNLPVNLAPLHR